ncbi:MAG: outer membrane lipoprotein carrier protein LolA [Ignavibacteriota bacterium]|nr:outer membrane lipoprotein carrier protein LolA [Ignavibacteriota bacterium]MCO6446782.1 outer membrane lipoprotein carrier protein LolA [Ignavibacterium album]QKK00834.1 MAG: outer membrane lipoprotein carrier protein LolA [Ignavibacteriota bacterium]HOJ07657.1 outer membrane lipoprotein carrier protein LolA [Ignavibacteriaceae bacterium]
MKTILSLIILFCSTVSFSQTAESVLKSLQSKINSIADLSANVTQSTNGKSSLSGKLFFKKENNLRLEFGSQTIIADGKTSWNYDQKNKKVIISNYDENGAGLLSIDYLVNEYPKECNLSLSSEGSKTVLVLKPKSKKSSTGEIKLTINKDNLIDKAVIMNQAVGDMEVSFSNYKLNNNLPESLFTFTAPEGTAIVDIR